MKNFKLIVGVILFIILLTFIMFFNIQELGRTRDEKENISPKQKKIEETIREIPETIANDVSRTKEKQPVNVSKESFTIQVASCREKPRAEILIEELNNKGHQAVISVKDLEEKGVWYRIWVGDFDDKGEAEKLLQELKKEHKNSFVKSK
ncbi:MAG: SPOR domain-containing protein [Candidatus Omnitrophota bacterium]